MTEVLIRLDEQIDRALREKARRENQSLEEYVQALAERAAQEPGPPPDFARRRELWLAWVKSHQPSPHVADDDREAIYAGRDE